MDMILEAVMVEEVEGSGNMKTPNRQTCNTADARATHKQVAHLSTPVATCRPPDPRDLVILLHGLNVTHHTMARIARALAASGYRVLNPTYPTRAIPLEQIATQWLPNFLAAHNAPAAPRLHFVTHSMGGLVVRLWLHETGAPANLARIVMIAPPNQGSEVPDHLRGNALTRFLTGINGARLGTDPESLPNRLTRSPEKFPAHIELGIIAGNRWLNPFFLPWIKGESDGTVSVASTRHPAMRDHIVMPHSHTEIIVRSAVSAQVIAFLRDGKFNRDALTPPPTRKPSTATARNPRYRG